MVIISQQYFLYSPAIFISDCVVFFDTIATFTQTIAGWVVLAGKNVAQISDGISNPVVAGIINWLIRILICGGCLVGVKEAVDANGFLGLFQGGFKASAVGISAALIFGYLASWIFEPKMRK